MVGHTLRNIFTGLMITAAIAVSCDKLDNDYRIDDSTRAPKPADRIPTPSEAGTRAHLMITVGFNNISSHLADDVRDLEDGFIPGNSAQDNLLFIFSHNTNGPYSKATSPVLARLYKGSDGQIYRQKLIEFEPGSIPNTKESLSHVLNFIRDNYHPSSCGVLMSSHGKGWTPPGYCAEPSKYENGSGFMTLSGNIQGDNGAMETTPSWNGFVPYFETGETPLTRSFGQTVISSDTSTSYETDIRELAEGIPFKLDYIIFDACFMGGVEVAYELKDKCRYMCASQAEILTDGMNYKTMISHLLEGDKPDLVASCREFYEYYDNKSGVERSATISMIDCAKLEPLAVICHNFFLRHEVNDKSAMKDKLQKYFNYESSNYHYQWFYDLKSIFMACGADDDETAGLEQALSQCVVYKAATPSFALYGFPITCHSGLSMYLPYPDRTYLNNYYKTLAWNEATGLIK